MTNTANIVAPFFEQARLHPHRKAIVSERNGVTFGELATRVRQRAASFRAQSLTSSDRVLTLVPMSIELYESVLAIFSLGATAVFLDQWSSRQRMREAARVAKCHAVLLPGGWKSTLARILVPELRAIPLRLRTKNVDSKIEDFVEASADLPALITFTTGSTGAPKAAVRTHGFLYAQLAALRPMLHEEEAHTEIVLLPIVLLLNLAIGRTSLLAPIDFKRPAAFNPNDFDAFAKTHHATSITGSPYYLISYAKWLKREKQQTKIRRLILGGAPAFPDDAKQLLAGFAEAKTNDRGDGITIVYGSTEAEPISHISAEELAKTAEFQQDRGLPVGELDEAAEVRILPYKVEPWTTLTPAAFAEACLDDDQVGELVVCGEHVLANYFQNDTALKANKIFVAEKVWHRTGDAACLRGKSIELFGRCKEVLNTDELTLYPFLFTYKLKQLEGIQEAAVLNSSAGVLCVYAGHANEDNVITYLEQCGIKSASVKRLESLPKDPRHFGKIDYEKLRSVLS